MALTLQILITAAIQKYVQYKNLMTYEKTNEAKQNIIIHRIVRDIFMRKMNEKLNEDAELIEERYMIRNFKQINCYLQNRSLRRISIKMHITIYRCSKSEWAIHHKFYKNMTH